MGDETIFAQNIQMVEDAQGSKPPVQWNVDVAFTYFIPAVLLITAFIFWVWFFLLGSTLLFALMALISLLGVACPWCARARYSENSNHWCWPGNSVRHPNTERTIARSC